MQQILDDIKKLILDARKSVQHNINTTMVVTYWHIGKRIVDEEQEGQKRAKYASEMMKHLSSELTRAFGRGFSLTNLKQMRQFYTIYSIGQLPTDNS